MFERILVALDGSEPARKATKRAVELASKTGAALELISVAEDLPHYVSRTADSETVRRSAREYYERIQGEAMAVAQRAGVPVNAVITYGHTVRATLDEIAARGTDLLVIGSAGHSGVFQRFLGGTTLRLVVHSPISVLVVRPDELGRSFKEVLVCVDGSPSSVEAMNRAVDLQRAFGATLRAIIVGDDDALSSVRAAILPHDGGIELETKHGQPVTAILAYADEIDADVVVVGATGRDHEATAKIGATAQRIAVLSPRSVLIVR